MFAFILPILFLKILHGGCAEVNNYNKYVKYLDIIQIKFRKFIIIEREVIFIDYNL